MPSWGNANYTILPKYVQSKALGLPDEYAEEREFLMKAFYIFPNKITTNKSEIEQSALYKKHF